MHGAVAVSGKVGVTRLPRVRLVVLKYKVYFSIMVQKQYSLLESGDRRASIFNALETHSVSL